MLFAMEIIPVKAGGREGPKDGRVRIITDELTDREVTSLRRFLEADPYLESVIVGPLSSFSEPPKRQKGRKVHIEGNQFLTIEISAAAEPRAPIIDFLKDNKDAIEVAVSLTAPLALGGKYVFDRLKEYCKKRKDNCTKIPLYVIKWTKRETKKAK